jgi:FlaA1/EpsC-like NDP-sugar epimerase
MSLVAAAFGTVCDIVGPRPMEKTDETLVSEFEVPRAMDIGNEIYIKPDPPFDYEIDYELGGIPLSKPYNSYTNPDYLTVDQIKDRIRNA